MCRSRSGGKTYNGKIEDGKAVFTLPKAKDAGKLKLRVVYKGATLVAAVKERGQDQGRRQLIADSTRGGPGGTPPGPPSSR